MSVKKPAKVLELASLTGRRRAPRRSGPARVRPIRGNLALQPEAAPEVRPTPFPTPSRWFSEANSRLGFRLWDVVYVFAIARQGLSTEEALGWGERYWAGGYSEDHNRAVLDLLIPGREDEPAGALAMRRALDAGFAAAIRQGAARLLGMKNWQFDELPVAAARRLQDLLEALYERQGWRLPALPLGLHMLLRKSGCEIKGFF